MAAGSLEPQVEHFMSLFVVRGETCNMSTSGVMKRNAEEKNSYSAPVASINCVSCAHD